MELQNNNYYSKEADWEYLSVSQYHSFIGTPFKPGCPARSMAKLRNEWVDEPSPAMLLGSYVDAYFEGTLDEFKANNPQIFTQKGELLATFKKATECIRIAETDPFFMKFMVGEGKAQVIVTGKIGGVTWKGKLDRLHPEIMIVDGKVVASIRDKIWDNFVNKKINFVEAYGYVDQGAVYRELVRQQFGWHLPFYIAALSKEPVPDHEIIYIPEETLDYKLKEIEENVFRIVNVKKGIATEERCGVCDYCRNTKKLQYPIYHDNL